MVIAADAWVPVAEIARPHGVKGELKIKLFNKDSNVLLDMDEVLLRMPDGVEHEVSIDGARRADQSILLRLHSVNDRDGADELRGALICVKRGAFPELSEGEFYTCDTLGAKVVLGDVLIGTVRDIRSYPTVDTLVVRAADGGKDWEIPLVEAFLEKADFDAGLVTLRTMEGLER